MASHSHFDLNHVSEYYGYHDKDDFEAENGRFPRPVFDTIREDDHDDFDLADIMSLATGEVDHDIDIMTPESRQLWVDLHNVYRANTTGSIPAASNMEFVSYNMTLEILAIDYARECIFAHGWGKNDKWQFLQGQSLYRGQSKLISRAVYLFYIEHLWWYWNNETCMVPDPPYRCGHLVQLLWHNSALLGAARRSHCFPVQSTMLFNVHYIHRMQQKLFYHMFKYGWHCTRCKPGMLCFNNMCILKSQCDSENVGCKCVLACDNCGQADWKRCRCRCKAGWEWEDCSYPCVNEWDLLPRKSKCIQADRSLCFKAEALTRICHAWCGVCPVIGPRANLTDLCCGGKVCDKYYALNETTCECELLCPSYKCLYPPSTTTTTTTTTTQAPRTKNIEPLLISNLSWILLPNSLYFFIAMIVAWLQNNNG